MFKISSSSEDLQTVEESSSRKQNKIFIINKYNFLKKKRKEISSCLKNPWTKEEDSILEESFYTYNSLSWRIISEKLKNRSAIQCMNRWKMQLKPSIKKGKWTDEEDQQIINYIKENGTINCNEISKVLRDRTSKQIRERYINHIEPALNNKTNKEFKWTDELDKLLIKNYLIFGSRWVQISQIIGTTENIVKNRFYSLLRQCVNKIKKAKKNNRIGSERSTNPGNEANEIKSNKEMILDDNPYMSKTKSMKKNYSLKILIEFLPELLEEKGININEIKNGIGINDDYQASAEKEKLRAVESLVSVISKCFNKVKSEKEEEQICSSKLSKSKSSILLNMQLCKLGYLFDRMKYHLIKKYFQSLKSKTQMG